MPYMTDMEEFALEEGLQKGLKQGLQKGRNEGLQKGLQKGRIGTLQEAVVEALEIRFDRVPEGLREAIRVIGDATHLRRLHKAAIKAPSIEAFTESL